MPVVATGAVPAGALVVLVAEPAVLEVTFSCTWQELLAASPVAVSRTLLSPAADAAPLVLVTVPQAAGVKVKVVFSSVKPAGKVSSTWAVVMAATLAAGLPSVRERVVLPPEGMDAAPKLLASVGGA